MEQSFNCPKCRSDVKPEPLACYSCDLTSEERPTVVTGEHQKNLAGAAESIRNAFYKLDEISMNIDFRLYYQELFNGSLDDLREALKQLDKLSSEF